MLTNHKALLAACIATLLAACGGGGDSGSSSTPAPATTPVEVAATYGSIYVNSLLGAGMTARYASQAEANAVAKSYCVSASSTSASALTCDLKLEFGKDLCGALYRSANSATTGAWGAASDGSAVTAEAKALASCKSYGGTNCTFTWSACNGAGSPSANSQIAFMAPNSSNSSGLPYEEALSEILQSDQPK